MQVKKLAIFTIPYNLNLIVKKLLFMREEITADTSVETLIDWFYKDITYDCHSIEARTNRSSARQELQRRGKEVLAPIGAHLFSFFPTGGFHELEEAYWNYFLAWGWLLFGIIKDHKLEGSPYPNKETFGEQNMNVWIAFCFRNAQ
ncbi:MAG: hypothetical protein WCF92_02410 [bacterium]